MAKFRKGDKRGSQSINTSSLPDIVFMLLFFFMVATKMRDKEVIVKTTVPVASELERIEKKSRVNYILIGPPVDTKKFGTAPQIQLDDHFAKKTEEVGHFIVRKMSKMPPKLRSRLITSLKADNSVRMGLITDVKQELRKANSLNILYNAVEGKVQNEN